MRDRSRTGSRVCRPAAPLTDIMVQLAPAHFDDAVACRLQQLLVMAHDDHACTHHAVPCLRRRLYVAALWPHTACARSLPSPPEEDCRKVPSHLHAARSRWFVGSSRKSTPAPLPEAEAALWPAGPSSRRASAILICGDCTYLCCPRFDSMCIKGSCVTCQPPLNSLQSFVQSLCLKPKPVSTFAIRLSASYLQPQGPRYDRHAHGPTPEVKLQIRSA